MHQFIQGFESEAIEANDEGLTTVEYAVAALVVTVGAAAAFAALGPKVSAQINKLVAALP